MFVFFFSVCLRLPSANACLLKHLLCVLHKIQQHSSENSMNSCNLAICTSQSLLWSAQNVETAAAPDAARASESMEKLPKLVQYLIENCASLFGEDCLSLFNDVSILSDVSMTNEEDTLKEGETESDSDDFHGLENIQFRVNTNGKISNLIQTPVKIYRTHSKFLENILRLHHITAPTCVIIINFNQQPVLCV